MNLKSLVCVFAILLASLSVAAQQITDLEEPILAGGDA